MRFISHFLSFAFAVTVLLEFALLQYVAPQLEFQSNYLNAQIPYIETDTWVETTVAPLETSTNRPLTRGIK